MGLQDSYKIFFAIPFDRESMSIHKDFIIPNLQKNHGTKLSCVIGKQQIGAPEMYEDIETFKMQNSELFRHFVNQIRSADIVIADLTDNNPNVHVELGLALSYNKNILRITRQSYERLGFDVRGYEVIQYKDEKRLLDEIETYIKLFFSIKNLDFKPENSKLYYHHPEKKEFRYWHNKEEKEKLLKESSSRPFLQHVDSNFHMRDGKICIKFKIIDERDEQDWFGVYLRAGSMGFLYGSILVYVRKNGKLEIATYPGPKIIGTTSLPDKCIGNRTLIIELEGDHIRANIDETELKCSGLNIQSRGEVKFASWFCNADFWDAQIVCRDTIETFDRLGLIE